MRHLSFCLVLCAALVADAFFAAAQELPPPARRKRPTPKPTASPSAAPAQRPMVQQSESASSKKEPTILLLKAESACIVAIDGEKEIELGANAIRKVPVSGGQHLLTARSLDGTRMWEQVIDAKSGGQIVVRIDLQAAGTGGTKDNFDAQLARVYVSLADLDVAGGFARARSTSAGGKMKRLIVGRKGDFYDDTPSLMLHSAHQTLKLEVEKLKRVSTTDSARRQVMDDVLRSATAADAFVDLLSKAITKAHEKNSWTGEPGDMYAQAIASLTGTRLTPQSMETMQSSAPFREALPREYRGRAGVGAEPGDIDLGATSFSFEPLVFAVVKSGGLADRLGFTSKDRLVTVRGVPATSLWDLETALFASPGRSIQVVVKRGEKSIQRDLAVPATLPAPGL